MPNLTNDPRIVRKRATNALKPRLKPPRLLAESFTPPRSVSGADEDLTHSLIDVLVMNDDYHWIAANSAKTWTERFRYKTLTKYHY